MNVPIKRVPLCASHDFFNQYCVFFIIAGLSFANLELFASNGEALTLSLKAFDKHTFLLDLSVAFGVCFDKAKLPKSQTNRLLLEILFKTKPLDNQSCIHYLTL